MPSAYQPIAARGSWQRSLERDLLAGRAVHGPRYGLRGKAQIYSPHYEESFHNLLARLRARGFVIERELGPRGGLYSATYWISEYPSRDA